MVPSQGIEIKRSGMERLNYLGANEKYHGPLRKKYQNICYGYPSPPASTLLALAVKAMNDDMNEEGLVTSLLLFRSHPRSPPINASVPAQNDRIFTQSSS